MTTELQQTKGTFKLIGKVTNIDRENNYVEKIAEKGNRKGDPQRQLRFGVITSPTNEIQVGMFSMNQKKYSCGILLREKIIHHIKVNVLNIQNGQKTARIMNKVEQYLCKQRLVLNMQQMKKAN